MANEEIEEKCIPTTVEVQDIPKDLELDDIVINPNKCLLNSYNVTKKYPDIYLVEGVILLIDHNNCGTAKEHAWNLKGNIHFDVTKTLWTTEEHKEVAQTKYIAVKIHTYENIQNLKSLEFSECTKEGAFALNFKISNQQKK
ncbi:hypothetical protein LJB98_01060 [Bacteroidales bacterium OttesenSCG-928-M11]|nr:hypothetical protein [Bacteroidales bacterium OttesenSCG-928-M11]